MEVKSNMKKEAMPYKKMILVCINLKEDITKPCCGRKCGEEIFTKLRDTVREKNLANIIRVSKADCLGKCANGPNVMVYPDEIWYSEVSIEDVETILKDILKGIG